MKLIKKIEGQNYIKYYYENNTIKYINLNNEIIWLINDMWPNVIWHKENGAALSNCFDCINGCHAYSIKNKYNKHYILNNYDYHPASFAEKTNHITCNICDDFCKQDCFIF